MSGVLPSTYGETLNLQSACVSPIQAHVFWRSVTFSTSAVLFEILGFQRCFTFNWHTPFRCFHLIIAWNDWQWWYCITELLFWHGQAFEWWKLLMRGTGYGWDKTMLCDYHCCWPGVHMSADEHICNVALKSHLHLKPTLLVSDHFEPWHGHTSWTLIHHLLLMLWSFKQHGSCWSCTFGHCEHQCWLLNEIHEAMCGPFWLCHVSLENYH